jgi:hypothetical protein
MDDRLLAQGVRRSWEFAKRLNLDETFSQQTSLAPTEEFRRLAADRSVKYEILYLSALRSSYYNFLISDYSFFQFWVNRDGHSRFAYYPNPFVGASQDAMNEIAQIRDYVEEDLVSYDEYLQHISEIQSSRCPPLVRYEYAPSQYVNLVHPCSHFHFGNHGENRWPSNRELTPAAFALIIFKQFYGEQWVRHGNEIISQSIPSLDECLKNERANSRILSNGVFSADEALQFHFT